MTKILPKWNSITFGNIFKHKRILLARLQGVALATSSQLKPGIISD